jgi:ABC-type antimicrobial peptide transport system permease subunit
LIGFAIFTGITAGLYPSLVVSKLNPVKVLSGFSSPNGTGFYLKRVLLTTQLIITVCLVFGVIVMHQQVEKMTRFDIGYSVENIVTFSNSSPIIKQNAEVINERLKSILGVVDVAKGPFPYNFNGFAKVELQLPDSLIKNNPSQIFVSNNFFNVMGLKLKEGSAFLDTNFSPENTCVINEQLAKELKIKNPVGATLNVNGQSRTVVGLVNDFSTWGVGNPSPMAQIFLLDAKNLSHSYLLKIKTDNREQTKASLESIWKEYETVIEPGIKEMDREVNGSIIKLSKSSALFSILAGSVLLLSLMNLFGLSIMFANSKIKSISIRKILGATVIELSGRLAKPFIFSLIIALLIALPLGYYLMESYLQSYKVRIDLSFVQGGIVSVFMLVLLCTIVGLRMLKISRINPVATLKND